MEVARGIAGKQRLLGISVAEYPTCTHLCVMAVDRAREAGLQYSVIYTHFLQANW